MSKIRIFQFPIRNSNGGITHYAMNNWNYIDKTRFECDFGTVSKKIDFTDSIIQSGAGLNYISCYAEEDEKRFVDELSSLFKYRKYDVVHLHTSFWKSFLVEQIAIACEIPKIIVHSHSTRVDIDDKLKRVEAERIHEQRKKEFNIDMATNLCACSKLAADWLFGEQIPRDKIKIMNNAIEVEKFLFNQRIRDKYRHEFEIEDCFVIGNVGRMVYQKNHEFLLDVFTEVNKKINNARLLLVGSGTLEKDIKKKAETLGILEKIIFTGMRNDVNYIMQAMDVFCLPSWFEGLPISLIEAQTSGLECIGSNKITDEVCISNNIRLLPLEIHRWLDRIVEISKGYERKNMYDIVTDSGYNIRNHIKKVEKLYMF